MADWRVKCNRCDTSEANLRRCTGCFTVYYCSRDCQSIDWTSHKKQCADQPGNQSFSAKCTNCNQSTPELKRCTRCYTVNYCSRECQQLDWTSHKKHCVMKTDNPSSDDRNSCKATIERSNNKQATERRPAQHTDDIEPACSSPPMKNTGDSVTVPENADQSSTDGGGNSSEALRDAERIVHSSNANATFKSTSNALGTSTRQAQSPLRKEKGVCRGCHLLFCTKKCGKCKAAFYCSRKCQRSDWAVHKIHCKKVSDEDVPQKCTPLTDDEAYIVDRMKRRQQIFNEAIFKRDNILFRFTQNPTGAFERFLAAGTPATLKIHERPPGSLSKALRYAKACFPGLTVIDCFEDIPHEWSSEMILAQELQKQSMKNVLVAFMFMYHNHVMRHGVFLKDAGDKITHVEFYFDHINDDPSPYFSYADLTPGNYILIQNPLVHQFKDGQVGIRINNPAEVKIGIAD